MKLALITGSMGLYAEIVARRLSIPHYFANTELLFDSSGDLVDYHYVRDQSGKKLEQFQDYYQTQRLRPDTIIVVGDSENDVDLFKHTGRGVLVGLDRPQVLRDVAWREVSSLLEIKQLADS